MTSLSDIMERLRDYASSDHKRGCQGRCYSCECGYDAKRDPLLVEAADEIERLRAAVMSMVEHFSIGGGETPIGKMLEDARGALKGRKK